MLSTDRNFSRTFIDYARGRGIKFYNSIRPTSLKRTWHKTNKTWKVARNVRLHVKFSMHLKCLRSLWTLSSSVKWSGVWSWHFVATRYFRFNGHGPSSYSVTYPPPPKALHSTSILHTWNVCQKYRMKGEALESPTHLFLGYHPPTCSTLTSQKCTTIYTIVHVNL